MFKALHTLTHLIPSQLYEVGTIKVICLSSCSMIGAGTGTRCFDSRIHTVNDYTIPLLSRDCYSNYTSRIKKTGRKWLHHRQRENKQVKQEKARIVIRIQVQTMLKRNTLLS